MVDYACIAYEVAEGFATVTLNRPEKRNALSRELMAELEAALWDADDDKAVHAVVIKGAGPDFCSAISSRDNAFRFSGRFNVTVAKPSATS